MLANGADKQQDKQDTQATQAMQAMQAGHAGPQQYYAERSKRGHEISTSRHLVVISPAGSCSSAKLPPQAGGRLQVGFHTLKCLNTIHRYSKKKEREMPVKEVWTGHAPWPWPASYSLRVQSARCRSNVSLSTPKGTSTWASIDGSLLPHASLS